MSDTVYLLGAGASCNCIPTVQNFTSALHQDFNLIGGLGTVLKSNFGDEFNKFHPALSKHRSLDTYARLLHLQGKENDYLAFKSFLDGYISARCFFNDDLRYNAFLADLGTRTDAQIGFSSKITIFTWNYDFLLEKELLFSNDVPKWNDIFSRFTHFNGVASGLHRVGNQGLSLLKELKEIYNERFQNNLDRYTMLVSTIIGEVKSERSHIRFAWENSDDEMEVIRSNLIKSIRNATNIVIVGYTFPFYNRLIDETFLNEIGKKDNIVIQDIDIESSSNLIDQLELLNDHRGLNDIKKKIKPYSNQNSFYVPFNLDLKKL